MGQSVAKADLPSVEHVVEIFDGVPAKDISKLIFKMGQRELQVCRLLRPSARASASPLRATYAHDRITADCAIGICAALSAGAPPASLSRRA